VRELANHLAARAVLDEQRVLPADLGAARYIGNFNEQRGIVDVDGRHTTIDNAFVGVNLCRCESHFIGEVVAGRGDTAEDFAHFGFVVNESQQRFAARARATDTQDVLGRRVQVDDEEVFVQQDDARTQAVDDLTGVAAQRSVTGPPAIQRTVFCWT
jgi:hypothetical protein